jgi:hypothetical protein
MKWYVASDSGADGGGDRVVGRESVVCGWGEVAQAAMAPERNSESSSILNKGIPFSLSERPCKTIRVFRITFQDR